MTTRRQPARFICGMSRSGSTWLAKTLNCHPDVTAWGESTYWGMGYVEPDADGAYGQEQLPVVRERLKYVTTSAFMTDTKSGAYRDLDRSSAEKLIDNVVDQAAADAANGKPWRPGDVFCEVGNRLAHAEDKTVWVEKTPHHVNWIDRILDHLPDSKVIVTIRDAYPFMLSYKYVQNKSAHAVAQMGKYHPYGAAGVWRGYMRSTIRVRDKYPDQVMILRSEDMWQRKEEVLQDVLAFFDLQAVDLTEAVPAGMNTSFTKGKSESLTGADVTWMNLVGGKQMALHGMPRQKAPFEPLSIAWSFIRWPIWAFRTAMAFRKKTDRPFRYLARWLRR